ncbi:MAG TPA: universal stress protein [Abditibacteriaceae bacterium]|nr:universal stress protein [Abditibacteriaceae bacterium]
MQVETSADVKEMKTMTFQKILCPTEFSEASYEGLEKAVELATPGLTELCVVHVEQPAALSPVTELTPYAHTAAERRAEAVANLCAVLDERVPSWVRTRPLLKCGDAATEIVRAARAENADLIVLTTHGAGVTQPGLLGGVAEEILRAAPCAVLTITAPANGQAHGIYRSPANPCGAMRPSREIVASKAIFLDGD